MQRRAVAVYVALFVVVAGAAGVLTVTAETPEITFEDPEFEVSAGDQIDADGDLYTVADITESEPDDDGRTTITGVLEREEPARLSETWENDSVVEVDEREWRVAVMGDEPTGFTLVEALDRQAILEADDAADNETYERDDGEFVAVTDESGRDHARPGSTSTSRPPEEAVLRDRRHPRIRR